MTRRKEREDVQSWSEQDQLHPTAGTGLLCYRGAADGGPTSCLGSRKACISPPSHCFHGAESSTLLSQVYSSGWHFRAILHIMCVTALIMFSSTSQIRIGRKPTFFHKCELQHSIKNSSWTSYSLCINTLIFLWEQIISSLWLMQLPQCTNSTCKALLRYAGGALSAI